MNPARPHSAGSSRFLLRSRLAKHHFFLLAAIAAEVVATTALARSEGFTKPIPSVVTVCVYALAFWCLSFPLRVMPTGVVYGIWSGMGIVLISAIGWIWYKQTLDFPVILGMTFILIGVVIVHLFSGSVSH